MSKPKHLTQSDRRLVKFAKKNGLSIDYVQIVRLFK